MFLGHSVTRTQNLSDDTQKLVDSEIFAFVEEGLTTAREILANHEDQLKVIAEGLLEYETLSGDEIIALLNGAPPVRDVSDDGTKPEGGSAVPVTGETGRRGGDMPDAGGMEPQPQS